MSLLVPPTCPSPCPPAIQWPDGEVKVIADNVPVPGSGRTELYPNAPLLSAAELSVLAVDPAWQRVAAGLPAP